ncbi:MAG TPA: hypothetical protein VFI73_13180 [Candidatus Nitrosopolaris sp.]|nr:hypothetical protein [Candidatus Nitrosopolaris sp.]
MVYRAGATFLDIHNPLKVIVRTKTLSYNLKEIMRELAMSAM